MRATVDRCRSAGRSQPPTCSLLNPQMILVGGELAQASALLIPAIERVIGRCGCPPRPSPCISPVRRCAHARPGDHRPGPAGGRRGRRLQPERSAPILSNPLKSSSARAACDWNHIQLRRPVACPTQRGHDYERIRGNPRRSGGVRRRRGVVGNRVILIASVAAMGGLLFGYDSAVINGAVSSIQKDFDIADSTLGFAVASALLGAAAGALNAGRTPTASAARSPKIAAVLFFVSAVGSAFAPEIWSLVFFRIVGGVGVGVASVIAPAYIAETSPARIRGRLGSLQQLAIVLGIFLSLLVDYLLAEMAGGAGEDLAWAWKPGAGCSWR